MSQDAARPGEDWLRPLWEPTDLGVSEARLRSVLDDEASPSRRAELLTQLARLELRRGRPAEAHGFLDQADKLAGETPVVRARILLERGRVLRHFGDVEDAKRLLEEAVDAALAANEPFIAADAAHSRALAGEITEWTRRGLELADTHPGAAYWRGTLLINLGEWHWKRGDSRGSLASFQAALAARQCDGRNRGQLEYARYGVARSLRNLGRAADAIPLLELAVDGASLGDNDESARLFRDELAAARADVGHGGEAL
jgi:tetratricopeptide (TPR) repeat protein